MEIEFTGITRHRAAEIVADYLGSQVRFEGGGYDRFTIEGADGRNWTIVSDASIMPQRKSDGRIVDATRDYKVEFVTPICTYGDIETVQELVRRFRKAGGFANDSCGIHVHIGANKHTAKTLRNLVNVITAKEDLLYRALQVNVDRESYCKRMDTSFLNALNNRPPRSISEMRDLWYRNNGGSDESRHQHYHGSRYHALNLHSVFTKGTIEFRLFNSSLKHAGKIKAYIQLCLAISHQALMQKGASRIRTVTDNPKYTFRCWLLRLGLIGDEFKTARTQLLEALPGNVAYAKKDFMRTKAKRNA